MTVNRTTLLDLPLPVTGTESGTWGDTTNNGLTQYLDIAIAGTLVLSTDADVTLTSTEGDSSATNIGATTAQYAILRWTATGSTTRNITALAQSKTYVVINATGGTQSIVLRGAGPTTGVTIISGEKAHCVWNGSDFVKVSSSAAAGGSNTQVQYNSSGVLAGSSNMTFDGTSLTLGGNPTLSGGTANGVLYLNGSKVATSGSALTFDGTNLSLLPSGYSVFGASSSEQMRLTSTGLGIGTSSPVYTLDVSSTGTSIGGRIQTNQIGAYLSFLDNGGLNGYVRVGSINNSLVMLSGNNVNATLDSSGNLGLGVTPSAWNSAYKAFQNAGGALVGVGTGEQALLNNAYIAASGNYTYTNSAAASRYSLSAGAHYWFTASSGTAGNAITFSQAMTLNASGSLLVGYTTAQSYGGQPPISELYQASIGNTDADGGTQALYSTSTFGVDKGAATVYGFKYNTAGNYVTAARVRGAKENATDGNFAGYLAFDTRANGGNITERARITSGGDLLVGITSAIAGARMSVVGDVADTVIRFRNDNASSPGGVDINYAGAAPNGAGNYFFLARDTGGNRFYVQSNGGIANYQGNDTNLSDRREKTNFAPAKPYLDAICAIPVQTFNYIDQSEDDPGLTLGVVAQDVQAVAPELVMESNWGTEDNPKMRLSIYQTDLQYALMKCIQEQQALITDLTARVALLEGN